MEHFISLTVKAEKLTKKLPKRWYAIARENLPDGLCTTFTNGDAQGRMKLTKKDGKAILTIPLVRNLTEREVEHVIDALSENYDGDFSVSSSRIQVGVKNEIEVEIDHDPLISLCTAWAKEQHDEWMKDKTEAGWRYGPTVSMANKTHPLMRPWADLPDAYRVIDTKRPEELLKMLNDHGYVLVAKSELDQLLQNHDPKV
jgi:hypothetical protein